GFLTMPIVLEYPNRSRNVVLGAFRTMWRQRGDPDAVRRRSDEHNPRGSRVPWVRSSAFPPAGKGIGCGDRDPRKRTRCDSCPRVDHRFGHHRYRRILCLYPRTYDDWFHWYGAKWSSGCRDQRSSANQPASVLDLASAAALDRST